MYVHKQEHRHLASWLLAAVFVLGLNLPEVYARWNYKPNNADGPDYWHMNYTDCGGFMQSPISISDADALYDPHLQLFDFSDYAITEGVIMRLENVGGHTAEVVVSGRELYLKGGSLPDKFKLMQLHFHWGQNGSFGSEHSYNGEFFPLEVHFVHRQRRLKELGEAASHPFGLAVVGFVFTVGRRNDKYAQLLQYFDQILNANDEVDIPTFPVEDLLPNSTRYDYYRYYGSLTTPPCYESVIWSFGADKIEISAEQLETFRTLFDNENNRLVDSFRPVQRLNNRNIYTTRNTFV